jgi:hypothetical protein
VAAMVAWREWEFIPQIRTWQDAKTSGLRVI